mgnify:CR=1 FL=1
MKHIWIIEKTSSRHIFYYNYSKQELDAYLVSGLLSALNTFSESELGDQGIESIDMGGLRWVYGYYPEPGIMIVAAGDKNSNANLMRARLDIIAKMFVSQYEITPEKLNETLLEITQFEMFKETLQTLHLQWEEASKIEDVGKLFDLLGVFQQIFIKFIKIINENVPRGKYLQLLHEINELTPRLEAENPMQESFRLIKLFIPHVDLNQQKIVFEQAQGTNVIGLNPIGIDADSLKSMFMIVLINYKEAVLKVLGRQIWLEVFNSEIQPLLFSKWDFLTEMKLMKEILETFLETSCD